MPLRRELYPGGPGYPSTIWGVFVIVYLVAAVAVGFIAAAVRSKP